MPDIEYPAVDFAEWFADPRKYRNKSVTIESTLVEWIYKPDRDPISVFAAGLFLQRGSELRLKLRKGMIDGDVYYRQETFWLFSGKREMRRQQFQEILDPLKGRQVKAIVHVMSAGWIGGHYFHLEGLELEGKMQLFNELPYEDIRGKVQSSYRKDI